MTATSTRSALLAAVLILFVGLGAGFYFAFEHLRAHAIEVSHAVVDAEASGKQIAELQALKQELANSESLVSKANGIFATRESYQSQAISDVQRYAQATGITILNTSFESATEESTDHTFVITLQSPVAYDKLIQFLDAIEGNLPRMQVSGITIGQSVSTTPGEVTSEAIRIKVTTR